MNKIIFILFVIILCSCSPTRYYLVYNADVYLDDKNIYNNVLVFDQQKENEIFFYDESRTGHLLMGNVSLKNCTDTTIIRKWSGNGKPTYVWRMPQVLLRDNSTIAHWMIVYLIMTII